jgi:hypothetical protein
MAKLQRWVNAKFSSVACVCIVFLQVDVPRKVLLANPAHQLLPNVVAFSQMCPQFVRAGKALGAVVAR